MTKLDSRFLDEKYPFSSRQLKIILESIPANVFFKDTKGRYQIVSHLCEMLNTGGRGGIVGKTDLEIWPDPALGRKFYDEDMEIATTINSCWSMNYRILFPSRLSWLTVTG